MASILDRLTAQTQKDLQPISGGLYGIVKSAAAKMKEFRERQRRAVRGSDRELGARQNASLIPVQFDKTFLDNEGTIPAPHSVGNMVETFPPGSPFWAQREREKEAHRRFPSRT